MTHHDTRRAVQHYGAMLAEMERPTFHRVTIEAYSLDPGTDLAECTFGITAAEGQYTRIVTVGPKSRSRVVGLWRIVPDA